MTNKQRLEEMKGTLSNDLSDLANDFINDYDLENIKYINDCFDNFAADNVNIYYADQRNYYYDHQEDCDNAFIDSMDETSILQEIKKYGVDSLICKAGAWGEYNNIICELYQQEKEIKKVLIIDYLLKKDNVNDLDFEKLEEIISNSLIDNEEELEQELNK